MKRIEQRLPFPLRGIDSDNGSEFINMHFCYVVTLVKWPYCKLSLSVYRLYFLFSKGVFKGFD
jgi:hypothetical protein